MKRRRSWLVALCIIGMASIFLLPALGISIGTLGSLALFLLCPLSHMLMLWRLRRRSPEEQGNAHMSAVRSTVAPSWPPGESFEAR